MRRCDDNFGTLSRNLCFENMPKVLRIFVGNSGMPGLPAQTVRRVWTVPIIMLTENGDDLGMFSHEPIIVIGRGAG